MKKSILLLALASLMTLGLSACMTHESDNSPQPSGQGGNRGESPGMKAKTSSGASDMR